MTYVLLVFWGMGLSARVTVCYVYMMELTHSRNKVVIGTQMMVIEMAALLLSVAYFSLVSNRYATLFYLAIGLTCVSLYLLNDIPESPILLLQKGRREEALAILRDLCRASGRHLTDDFTDLNAPDSIQEQSESLFYDWNSTRNLCALVLIWVTVSFNYYLINLFLKYIPGNIYQNTAASCSAELFAAFLSSQFLAQIGIKWSLCFLFLFSAVSGVCLIKDQAVDGSPWTPLFVMSCKFGISGCFNAIYIGTATMFKPSLSGTAFGVCNFFARLATIFAPLIAEWEDPIPLTILVTMCICAAALVSQLSPIDERLLQPCQEVNKSDNQEESEILLTKKD